MPIFSFVALIVPSTETSRKAHSALQMLPKFLGLTSREAANSLHARRVLAFCFFGFCQFLRVQEDDPRRYAMFCNFSLESNAFLENTSQT
jgi:hypothetical protein